MLFAATDSVGIKFMAAEDVAVEKTTCLQNLADWYNRGTTDLFQTTTARAQVFLLMMLQIYIQIYLTTLKLRIDKINKR